MPQKVKSTFFKVFSNGVALRAAGVNKKFQRNLDFNLFLLQYFSIKAHFAKWNLKKEHFKGVEIYPSKTWWRGGKKNVGVVVASWTIRFVVVFANSQKKI